MKRFIIFSFFCIFSVMSEEKYQNDISIHEKRVNDYRKEKNFPSEWKLFYKCLESDYAVFYDLEGQEVFFKYRKNKFDLDASFRVSGLVPGQSYRVYGRFIGLFIQERPDTKEKFLPQKFISLQNINETMIESINSRPVHILQKYESTALDEVIK